ncbi:hypothetical protein N431DRAFT_111842, partial [Stipitochalara longipes BDJ]
FSLPFSTHPRKFPSYKLQFNAKSITLCFLGGSSRSLLSQDSLAHPNHYPTFPGSNDSIMGHVKTTSSDQLDAQPRNWDLSDSTVTIPNDREPQPRKRKIAGWFTHKKETPEEKAQAQVLRASQEQEAHEAELRLRTKKAEKAREKEARRRQPQEADRARNRQ